MPDDSAGGCAIIAERWSPDRGGLARASERIAQLAAVRGERVHAIAPSDRVTPGALETQERGAVTVHQIGVLPRPEDTLRAWTDHAVEIIRGQRLDLVHGIYCQRAGYVATLAAGFCDTASVVSLRGNDFDRGLFRPEALPFLEHALRRANVATAVTKAMASRAEVTFGRRVVPIANAVDAEVFRRETPDNSLRASLRLGDGQVLGFSGELREKKGMRYLLPAFAALQKRRDLHLLLIGGVRKEAAPALDAFRRADTAAAERVHILAYDRSARRLSGLLALCDVMVFPSLFEGMPNAVLEAMAAECAIVASDVDGHRELIEHGVSGALLSLAELDLLPQAIEEMLELSPEKRSAFGKAARKHVLAHHHPDRESEAWGRAYTDARGSHSSNSHSSHSHSSQRA